MLPRRSGSPYARLAAFLADRVRPEGRTPTHTSIRGFPGGSFSVATPEEVRQLHHLYVGVLTAQPPASSGAPDKGLCLIEQHSHPGAPILIDLDLRTTSPQVVATPQRVDAFLAALCAHLATLVCLDLPPTAQHTFDTDDDEEEVEDAAPVFDGMVRLYVLEKPPRPVDANADADKPSLYKDGVHIVIPGVVTRPELQEALRERMLPCVADIFGTASGCTNPADDIYDEAVIRRNGWMMIGSKKPGEPHAWTLARVLTYCAATGVLAPDTLPLPSLAEQAVLFSIRHRRLGPPSTDLGERLLDEADARQEADIAARQAAVPYVRPDGTSAPQANAAEIAGFMDLLSDQRAFRYSTWNQVALLLYNITHNMDAADSTDVGRRLLHAFSERGGAKYSARRCDEYWDRLRPAGPGVRPLGMGTLVRWAREDSPMECSAYEKEVWCRRRASGAKTMSTVEATNCDWDCRAVAQAAATRLGLDANGDTLVTDAAIVDDRLVFKVPESEGEDAFVNLRTLQFGWGSSPSGFLHDAAPGMPMGPLVLKGTDAPASGWNATRPTDDVIIMQSDASPKTSLSLDLHNGELARVTVIQHRKTFVLKTNKDMLTCIEHAYRDAIKRHLAEALRVPVGVINTLNLTFQHCTFNSGTATAAQIEEKRTADAMFLPILRDSSIIDDIVAVNNKDVYLFRQDTGIWKKNDVAAAACHLRMQCMPGGRLAEYVTATDSTYMLSFNGPLNILKSIYSEFLDESFADRLDVLPSGCIPFDNGMFDANDGTFRSFVREDYVSATIGYPYEPYDAVPMAMHTFIVRFYSQVLPQADEREYFSRIIANALLGAEPAKYFLVLTDERDGSNGKTTLMRAVEGVFGRYTAAAERSFLYQSGNNNPNAHAANLLAYTGKRIAFFDEPEPGQKLDMRKIKDLSSGDARIRGRSFGAEDIVDKQWECLITVAANEANMPAIDASDKPLLLRMKALKMRGLFLRPEDLAAKIEDGEEHVFALEDDGFKTRLKVDARMAHFHLLVQAFRRSRADPSRLGPEPASLAEMVNKILENSDPRIEVAIEYVERRLDFNPPRTPEMVGRRYYAWLSEKELFKDFWGTLDARTCGRKPEWKGVLRRAMERKGRPLKTINTTVADGSRVVASAFDMVTFLPHNV